MNVFIAVHTAVIMLLIPFTSVVIMLLEVFHVVVMIFSMLVSAVEIVPFAPDHTFCISENTYDIKPEVTFTILSGALVIMPFIVSVILLAKFISVPVTVLVLELMLSASLCIKSGIQLSKSVRGPSSGTEKCRKERILSATPLTASAMALILLLIPLTILLMISAPHCTTCDARFLMKFTAALKPFSMVVFIPVLLLDIAVFMLSQIEVTTVFMVFSAVKIVFLMLFQIFATVAKIVFRMMLMKPLIAFHTADTTA